jgi:hypothetical protein
MTMDGCERRETQNGSLFSALEAETSLGQQSSNLLVSQSPREYLKIPHNMEREKRSTPVTTQLHTPRTQLTSIGIHNTTTPTIQFGPRTIKQHTSHHIFTRIGAQREPKLIIKPTDQAATFILNQMAAPLLIVSAMSWQSEF